MGQSWSFFANTGEKIESGLVSKVKEEPPSDSSDMKQRIGEADDDYLVRTCRFVVVIVLLLLLSIGYYMYCRYCQASEKLSALEQLLHCDGIWLHALRYIGCRGFLMLSIRNIWT